MNIDARTLDHRKINELLKSTDEVTLNDCFGQRFIGSGTAGKSITVYGTPGNALGCYLNGGVIEVFGNAQDAVGDTMNNGKIIIHGNVGDALGYAMRGGQIFVQGDVGYRAGIHIKQYEDKKPVIVIGGKAGSFLGEYQAGGIILVLGIGCQTAPFDEFAGTGIHGGKIIVRSPVPLSDMPSQINVGEISKEEKEGIEPLIAEYLSLFNVDKKVLSSGKYYCLRPNVSNPYKNLYTLN